MHPSISLLANQMHNIIFLTLLVTNHTYGLVSIESLEDRVRNKSALVVVATLKQTNIVRVSDGEYLELMELDVKEALTKDNVAANGPPVLVHAAYVQNRRGPF